MHFFSLDGFARYFQFFRTFQSGTVLSGTSANALSAQTAVRRVGRVRAKAAERRLPVLDELEFRQTVSDTFFTGLQLAGAGLVSGVADLDRSRDPFEATNLADITVSGGSNAGSGRTEVDRGGWHGAVLPEGDGSGVGVQGSGMDGGDAGFGAQRFGFDRGLALNAQPIPAGSDRVDSAALDANTPVLGDVLDSVVPRAHGEIRKLKLAPSASAVGAGSTFVASTADAAPRGGSDIEIPSVASGAAGATPIRVQPFVPPSPTQPAGGELSSPGSDSAIAASPDGDAVRAESADGSSSQPESALGGAGTSAGAWQGGVDAAGFSSVSFASSTASPNAGGPFGVPPGQNCSGSSPPGQGGGVGQSGGGLGQSGGGPVGPPCIPPGQQASSVADPLYVLNWHEQLVMFPGVVEFDQVGDYVELRAQVYGATVQSYSWDTSQASRLGCATGTSTYKLQFRWTGYGPIETTEQITITATMTDQTTQQQTLTFKLAPGSSSSCPSSGGFPTTTWPAVLTPDKPLEAQDVIASDSATRPYAISQASGVLYVGHALPGYNPGVPALALAYSSMAAERRPIFVGRYELDPSAAVPNTVSARLQFNGSWGSSKYYDTSPSTTKYNPGDIIQISLQADAGSLSTGRYDYTFETTANYSGSSTTTSSSGSVTIVNEESSVFGEGWTLDIVDRLHVVTGGVILNQGAANSLWFAGSGPYTTPAGDFSTLVKNGDNTYTRTLKNGVKQNFNPSGYQTSLVDLNSNRLTFTYDGSNNLSTVTDPNNLVTTFGYTSGNVSTITDPANRIATLSYSSGRLQSIQDPDAAITTFSYDSSSGRMATYKDARSNVTTFTYDFAGRVDTVTRPDTTTESLTGLQLQSLCDSGQCTSGQPGTPLISAEAVADYTTPRSNAWDTRLDWYGLGTTTQLTDPLGQSTPAGHMIVLHRNSNGSVTQSTDRLDRNIGYTLDSKANVTKITFPAATAGSTTVYYTQQFEYNSNSQLTKRTDEISRVTSFTYDSEGNLTQITRPDPDDGGPLTSPITTLTYTADGFVETVVDPRSNTTTFSYDSRDRVTQITVSALHRHS